MVLHIGVWLVLAHARLNEPRPAARLCKEGEECTNCTCRAPNECALKENKTQSGCYRTTARRLRAGTGGPYILGVCLIIGLLAVCLSIYGLAILFNRSIRQKEDQERGRRPGRTKVPDIKKEDLLKRWFTGVGGYEDKKKEKKAKKIGVVKKKKDEKKKKKK